MSEEIKPDPVTSPETPVTAPSAVIPPVLEANPEPASGTTPAASPPASGKEPVPAQPKALEEQDVLDRLSPEQQKTTSTPVEESKTVAETPQAKADGAEDSDEIDPNEAFKPITSEELAGHHSKTRKRFKQLDHRIKSMTPYAEVGADFVRSAADSGVTVQTAKNWLDLGAAVRRGDQEALQALADVLDSHGQLPKAQPAAAPDFSGVETIIARLHRDLNIDDAAKEQLEAALRRAAPAKAPAVQQQQAPAPQQQRAPQQQQRAPQADPIRETASWVQREEQKFAQQHGQKWPELQKQIYAEAARREAGLPIDVVNHPIEMRIRYAACAAHVLAKASVRPPTVPIQPTLRSNPGTTPIKRPEKGTEAYEDALLSGTL